MLTENIDIIKNTVLQYIGNGVYHILFLITLVAILIKEKDKNKKALLVGFSIFVLLTILNPFFNKCINNLLNENVYWRTIWMLPVGLNIAYLSTIIIKMVPDKFKKIVLFCLLIFVISLSGSFIYTKDNFSFYHNYYKIPDEYLDIINTIQEINIEKKTVMVPTEMIEYVRQIDASIHLAYMRKSFDEYNLITIVNAYYSGDVEKFMKSCELENVNIIVHDKKIQLSEPLENYGFKLYRKNENYEIYVRKK